VLGLILEIIEHHSEIVEPVSLRRQFVAIPMMTNSWRERLLPMLTTS
jgi:hypothetical protein